MKKLITILLLTLTAGTVLAQHSGHGIRHGHNHHHHRGHYYSGNNWMAPLIIGGSIGYILNRPSPVYIEPPPVIQPQCSRYTRYIYQDQNGQVLREEIRCD